MARAKASLPAGTSSGPPVLLRTARTHEKELVYAQSASAHLPFEFVQRAEPCVLFVY